MSSVKKEQKGITRRDFVKGAAVGAVGGLVVGAGGTALLMPKAESKPGLPPKWDRETDVVVAGTGCGLAAAIEAKAAGAEVLLLERNDWVGGLYISAGGSCSMGGNNVVQQRDGVVDNSLELWYQEEMYSNEYRGVPEIMRTLVARGADTVKWLQDLGMVWAPIAAGVLRPPIKRGLSVAPSPNYLYREGFNNGIAWTTVMKKKVDALGVPILLKHRMKRIHRPDLNGPVLGVEVETPQGTINIKARKAVVLCTGTWTDNARMAQAWDPRIVGPDTYGDGGTPYDGTLFVDSAGDGHLAAAEIGAGFSDMSFTSYLYIFYGNRSYWGWEPPDFTKHNYQPGRGLPRTAAFFQRVILVKNDGVRWINEAEGAKPGIPGRGGLSEWPEWPYTATYLSLPQPRNVWAVSDADGAAALAWPVADMKTANPKVGNMFDPACLAVAETLAELASKMGINAANLGATVSKYNGFVDAGVDADFKKPMPLNKIAKPPFYGAKASLIRHTQRNGLRVNTKSQVLEQADQKDGKQGVSIDTEKIIPHLYAAGELGNALGWRRPHNSLGHYVTAARIAGENAAKETSLS